MRRLAGTFVDLDLGAPRTRVAKEDITGRTFLASRFAGCGIPLMVTK